MDLLGEKPQNVVTSQTTEHTHTLTVTKIMRSQTSVRKRQTPPKKYEQRI